MKTNRAGLLLIVFALLTLAACRPSVTQPTPPATVAAVKANTANTVCSSNSGCCYAATRRLVCAHFNVADR